jgi:hypothetical protein
MRGTFNNMTLDGINNQDAFIRTDAFFGTIPVRESFVEEFAVTTSNADQTSGYGSSQTQFVTRSGSNEFHGEVYYYHKNDAFNANEFFNNAAGEDKPKLRDHSYGGTIGGPIVKDKLFFFFGLEFQDVPSTLSVTRSVLTDNARRGLFSYLRQDTGEVAQVDLFDVTGVSPDSITSGLVNSTPLPNDPTASGLNSQSFRFNSDARTDQRWITSRVDYELSDAHTITGAFHNFNYDLPNDVYNGIGEVLPGMSGFGLTSKRYLASVAWLSTWSPNLTNELRGGLQRYEVEWAPNGPTSDYILDFNTDLIDNPIQDADSSQGRTPPVWELQDNVNWINGNHTFTFGGSYRYTKVDQFNAFGVPPTYTLDFGVGNPSPLTPEMFPGGVGSSDFSDAEEILYVLGGFVDSADQTFNATSNSSGFVPGAPQGSILKQNFLTFHGGDTWRVSPNVTLNYGLRWEWHGVPYEINNLALLPKEQSIQAVLDPNAIIDYAGPGVGRPFFKDDYNNFAPNVGLAWRYCDTWVFRAGYSLNYVVDNNMTVVNNALRGNDGLNSMNVLTGLSGTVSDGLPAVPTPEFKVPRTARDNILLDTTSALYTIDPNLKVPYVHQWNVGIQKEIVRDLAFEARYVGNNGKQLTRAIDINQVKFPNEFVQDWQRARRNLVANGDPYTGEELTYIPNLGLSGYMFVGFVQNMLFNNEIGDYIGGFLAPNRTFFFAGEGGEGFGATVPISDFYTNPNAFVGDYAGNNAYSEYHGMQLELRRRFRSGFTGQVNYSWGKVLTDHAGSQTGFRGLFDNAQPELEKMRPDYDIAHTINANFIWELPFGYGRRFLDQGGIADAILGGWNLTGIIRARSGETVNIISNRGTINRGGARAMTNTVHLEGMTVQDLQSKTGLYRDSEGRIRLFDSSLIGEDGRASTQYFSNPGLLEAGTLQMSPAEGPWYSTFDFGIRKRFGLPLNEVSAVEVRFDMFNAFNRANFNVTTTQQSFNYTGSAIFNVHNINSSDFGVIDETFSAREIQMGIKIMF